MKWFAPHEFDRTEVGGEHWFFKMSPEVLNFLDELRGRLGAPIHLSPVRGSLGRYMGASFSDHNFEKWGEVRAADIFPTIDQTPAAAERFLELCKSVGVTAIGCYPHWRNRNGVQQVGFHIGWRPDRVGGPPALWGMIKPTPRSSQQMVPITKAFSLVDIKPGENP